MDMRWFPGRSILNSDWTVNLTKTNINKQILIVVDKRILMHDGHTAARCKQNAI